MKSFASFDDYLNAQSVANQTIIRALRRFVKRVAPALDEAVKWGNGCWIGRSGPVAYVYSDKDLVQFGFFHGANLKDPKKLLEGKGQYVRHIKVRDRSGIQEKDFAALLRQAAGSGAGRAKPSKSAPPADPPKVQAKKSKSATRSKPIKSVIDDYLARLPADKQSALEKLRAAIRAAAPRSEECFSYGLPAFRLDGKNLVYFAAAAGHCALYPGSANAVAAHKDELKDYKTSKGAIRFPAAHPLPAKLVKKIVKFRIAENAGEASTAASGKARRG